MCVVLFCLVWCVLHLYVSRSLSLCSGLQFRNIDVELLAVVADQAREKWSKNHGAVDDGTVDAIGIGGYFVGGGKHHVYLQ